MNGLYQCVMPEVKILPWLVVIGQGANSSMLEVTVAVVGMLNSLLMVRNNPKIDISINFFVG